MRTLETLGAPTLAIMFIGTVSGCAGFSEYRKCGYGSCAEDAKLTQDIHARLDESRELAPPDQIYVQTLDGSVYLSGSVLTAMQRDTAVSIAGTTPGVRRVVDDLFVSAESGR